jgi:branched-chain amino acid transport system ATP-binding protein
MNGQSSAPLLDVRELVVRFGGLRAVDGVSFAVPGTGITGLIGPNGAGKTTLIDAISGFVPIAEGSVIFGGDVITTWSPHRRARNKLTRTFQSLELFEDLTVAENVQVTTEAVQWAGMPGRAIPIRGRHERTDVTWALSELDLADVADASPGELSQAQRKFVALARAIAARPRLLMLDEPAAGLDPSGTEDLGLQLQRLADSGITLLLVDHDMALMLKVCDFVYVLDAGKLIAHGTPSEIRTDPEVLRCYLGEDPSSVAGAETGEPA